MKSQQPIGRDQIQGDKSGQGLCIINVGKGQDGQVWHAVGIATFGVVFLNVPGYYSLHPDGLLLPAEVVNPNTPPKGSAPQTSSRASPSLH